MSFKSKPTAESRQISNDKALRDLERVLSLSQDTQPQSNEVEYTVSRKVSKCIRSLFHT